MYHFVRRTSGVKRGPHRVDTADSLHGARRIHAELLLGDRLVHEAPRTDTVFARVEEQAAGEFAVSSAATALLVVAVGWIELVVESDWVVRAPLERGRQVVVHDVADVGLIDAHAPGHGGDEDVDVLLASRSPLASVLPHVGRSGELLGVETAVLRHIYLISAEMEE